VLRGRHRQSERDEGTAPCSVRYRTPYGICSNPFDFAAIAGRSFATREVITGPCGECSTWQQFVAPAGPSHSIKISGHGRNIDISSNPNVTSKCPPLCRSLWRSREEKKNGTSSCATVASRSTVDRVTHSRVPREG
jgi:hypothetical protein